MERRSGLQEETNRGPTAPATSSGRSLRAESRGSSMGRRWTSGSTTSPPRERSSSRGSTLGGRSAGPSKGAKRGGDSRGEIGGLLKGDKRERDLSTWSDESIAGIAEDGSAYVGIEQSAPGAGLEPFLYYPRAGAGAPPVRGHG